MSCKRKLGESENKFVKRTKVEIATPRFFRSRTTPRLRVVRAQTGSLPLRPVIEGPTQRAVPSNLAQRAIKRQEFDAEQRLKFEEIACMKREDDSAHALRESESIKELRKAMLFHAHPISKYSCLCVHRSERKLTQPHSPRLQTAIRAEMHNLGV